MEWGNVILPVATVAVFLLQLFLCLRTRRVYLRILPVLLCIATVIVFYVLARNSTSWDAIGYVLLFVLSLLPLGGCLLAFGVWAIILLLRYARKKKGEL